MFAACYAINGLLIADCSPNMRSIADLLPNVRLLIAECSAINSQTIGDLSAINRGMIGKKLAKSVEKTLDIIFSATFRSMFGDQSAIKRTPKSFAGPSPNVHRTFA